MFAKIQHGKANNTSFGRPSLKDIVCALFDHRQEILTGDWSCVSLPICPLHMFYRACHQLAQHAHINVREALDIEARAARGMFA